MHVITPTAYCACSVFAIDVDVLSASIEDHTIAWYEIDGQEGFTKHVITTTARNPSCSSFSYQAMVWSSIEADEASTSPPTSMAKGG